MGQKINPNIFRLGVNKTWKTEFFEKKRHELSAYTFKDLEIKSYIERFLESQGLLLHDYKQHYSSSTLNIYISYLVLVEFPLSSKKDIQKTVVVQTKNGERKTVSQNSSLSKTPNMSNSGLTFTQKQNTLNWYKIKKYLNSSSNRFKATNITSILTVKSSIEPTILQVKSEGVLNNLFKVLSLFTKNKFNLIINFCCLNKTSSFLKNTQKKNFILLQKFKTTPFLKEGIELLFHVTHNVSSAKLLSTFVASQIKKGKRHKFFLSFLKHALSVLSTSKFSTVRGVKIRIQGRLNGVPRARHKTITIGDVPVQKISARIDYAHTTTHNANGSYGIKVWILEKSSTSQSVKNVLTTTKNKI